MSKSIANSCIDSSSEFLSRHIAPSELDQEAMLRFLGFTNRQAFIQAAVPNSIRENRTLELGAFTNPLTEVSALSKLRAIAKKNKVFKSWIGQGYYNTHTPAVIQRNILENPAWYTAYTPYQPEISQGRLEAIINFQQVITDLTGMDIANASMLDEGTAAAEAMTLAMRSCESDSKTFLVDKDVLPQTLRVIKTRAEPLGIQVLVDDLQNFENYQPFAALIQYPGCSGALHSLSTYQSISEHMHRSKGLIIVATDLLALAIIKSPKEFDADIVLGNSQRFGVPIGFGGPHAAFLATKDSYKRNMPGRLVGVSVDNSGLPAYRLALQTREQHIRREKATSNICTAQVLLAVMAGMYAVYHGPKGIQNIAKRTHHYASVLHQLLTSNQISCAFNSFFDTIQITSDHVPSFYQNAISKHINLRLIHPTSLSISLDETTIDEDIYDLADIFGISRNSVASLLNREILLSCIPESLQRNEPFLEHPTFNRYHAEHEMLRYIRKLADKDLALDRTMIPLGSCTMKLNASSEMFPVTWVEFNSIHPFAPADQWRGYAELIEDVEHMMCAATGYDSISLQPNAGSQGEYAGLLIIRAYHIANNQSHRNICLIPSSAHGTNPASAQMAGFEVVVVSCDADGNIDIVDLKAKLALHQNNVAAMMITYPSTHGVFEENVRDICDLIHDAGGQIYIDGANMNALVGTASPGIFGGDVSHLNLHKTFCIPHGGGGPGVGPVAVKKHLAPYLPSSFTAHTFSDPNPIQISAAPFGSASILPISWMYVAMMGSAGLKAATEVAILSANYVAKKLSPYYPILYKGSNDLVAHECIVDLRPLQKLSGISNEDVAKRLIDFGFHAPTMSFPVPGTLMIEPTESESKAELDRFIEAMVFIRSEIDLIIEQAYDKLDNPLKNAPHTARSLLISDWKHPYSREIAAYPVRRLYDQKYWTPVGRIDNVHGDRNLFCSCVPLEVYED